jgi:hypothetical protein
MSGIGRVFQAATLTRFEGGESAGAGDVVAGVTWPITDVHGFADPKFDRLCQLLSGTLDTGDDLGASVSVTLEGETVVDIW